MADIDHSQGVAQAQALLAVPALCLVCLLLLSFPQQISLLLAAAALLAVARSATAAVIEQGDNSSAEQ